MKRVLFGIMALSVATFAANPGTGTATTEGTASVPVKVLAEITAPQAGLTITDEAGTVLDELLIDHGRIVKGAATDDSKAFKLFKVKMGDSSNEYVEMNGKLTVNLNKYTTKLIGPNSGKLDSVLSLAGGKTNATGGYEAEINGTEHTGRVNSVIPRDQLNATKLEEGIYNNGADRPTLTVVYTPTPTGTGGVGN
ncbi:hypothetical protein [Cetobacterium sp. ZOR0034]|uniref:hypothetical protein n=1 Tax=Cetobacterium sp. ZOR0034 TaxID=1339239 RepID=UPI0006461AD3|nr:hypothetical protein [Cetobacterium sp. ZOR0034]